MTLEAKTHQEVAANFGITPRTLSRWMKKFNIDSQKGGRLTPKTLLQLYEVVGNPNYPEKKHQKF
jgi:transposase-like protein